MNKDRIELLAATIERAAHADPELYNKGQYRDEMDDWDESDREAPPLPESFALPHYRIQVDLDDSNCETIGCIAGFCVALFPEDIHFREEFGISYIESTARALGVSVFTAQSLCAPAFHHLTHRTIDAAYEGITPHQAAQAVRSLIGLKDPDANTDLLWGHVIEDQADE